MTRPMQATACPTEQLILYHYADLDGPECQWLEGHLQQCAHCRDDLAELRATLATVADPACELSGREVRDFNARVMQALPQRRGGGRAVMGWSLAAACVLLLTLSLPTPIEHLLHPQPQLEAGPLVAQQELTAQMELLQNLDLLENLDLLQQLASVD